jgi:hypothetical protein
MNLKEISKELSAKTLCYTTCPYQKLHPARKSLKSAVSAASFLCHESCPIFIPFYALVFSDPGKDANRDSCSAASACCASAADEQTSTENC